MLRGLGASRSYEIVLFFAMVWPNPEITSMRPNVLEQPLLRTRAFELAMHAARRSLARRSRLMRLVLHASHRLTQQEPALNKVRSELHTLLRIIQAWVRREYHAVPWRSLLYGAAALAYFINPADLLPDALPGLGLVDDAAVIAAVSRAIRADLDRFRQWEATHEGNRHETV